MIAQRRAWLAAVAVAGCLLAGCGTGEQTTPPAGPSSPQPGTTAPASPTPTAPRPSTPGSTKPETTKPETTKPSTEGPDTEKPGTFGPPPGETEPGPTDDPTAPPTAPATTEVPPPSSDGGVKKRVAPEPVTTRPPVAVDRTAEVEKDLTVRIERTEKIDAKAMLPGEVAGPAVVFHLVADNQTSEPVDLSAVVVECTDAADAACNRISTEPAAPFAGVVAAGATASGRYVFVIPDDQRDPVSLVVTLTGDRPVVVFEGRVG